MSSDYVMDVLRLLAENDCTSDVWWRTDDECAPVTFFINCSDFFWWGCSDCEPITPETLAVLAQCFVDEREATGKNYNVWAPLLFCARVRGMRPQGCAYPKDEAVWPLFDACGPKREIDIANPYAHPADGGEYEYTCEEDK